jgi:hypothetical protein
MAQVIPMVVADADGALGHCEMTFEMEPASGGPAVGRTL